MGVALLALFVALDGPATAARLIDGRSIKKNSVTTTQVRNGSLGAQDLSQKAIKSLRATPWASVGAQQLRDGAVGNGALGAQAVTPAKIADGAVGSAAVADGGLQTKDLGDFYGSVSVDFDPFPPNSCQVAKDIAPQPSAPAQGNVIADDVVSVSAGPGWPDPIVVSGNPGAGNTLRIVACRVGGRPPSSSPSPPNPPEPPDLIDPGPVTFTYAAFDAP